MPTKFGKNSFLYNADTSDSMFLGLNKLPKIPATLDDEPYTIGHGYEGRPDLLADILYQDSKLWWVFALRNPDLIKDPIRDFKTGVMIMVPPLAAVDIYK